MSGNDLCEGLHRAPDALRVWGCNPGRDSGRMFKLVAALPLGFSSSKNCFAEAKGGFISSGSLELSGAVSPQIALAVRFPAFK